MHGGVSFALKQGPTAGDQFSNQLLSFFFVHASFLCYTVTHTLPVLCVQEFPCPPLVVV